MENIPWQLQLHQVPYPWSELGVELMKAVLDGDVPKVEQMLASGVHPDHARTRHGRTAMWLAVNKLDALSMCALLRAGSDPTIEDDFGISPLTHAAEIGFSLMIEIMAEDRPEVLQSRSAASALYRAASNSNVTIVRCLLSLGVSPNAHSFFALPALHGAVGGNRISPTAPLSCVLELLTRGAEVTARDIYGRTALHLAAQVDDPAIVQLLVVNGATLEARDNVGRIPREYARSDVVRDLLTALPCTPSDTSSEHSGGHAAEGDNQDGGAGNGEGGGNGAENSNSSDGGSSGNSDSISGSGDGMSVGSNCDGCSGDGMSVGSGNCDEMSDGSGTAGSSDNSDSGDSGYSRDINRSSGNNSNNNGSNSNGDRSNGDEGGEGNGNSAAGE